MCAPAPQLPFNLVTGRCRTGGPPNAGLARAKARSLALQVAPDGIVITTDADSEPRPDWIGANLTALNFADVVAGRIVWDPAPEWATQAKLTDYYDRLHALRRSFDPVAWEGASTHQWVSGASLAVTARVYRGLGGIPATATSEDAEFARVASRGGYRVRGDAQAVVRTSTRTRGRAQDGFAATVAATMTTTVPPGSHIPRMMLGGTPPRPVYEAIGIAELLYYRSANKVEKLAHLVVARLRAGGKLVLPHHRITFYDFAQHADAIHDRFLAATKRPWNCRTVRKTRR